MNNPILTQFVNARMRPDAERVRNAYARGVDMGAALTSTIAPLLVAEGVATIGGDGSLVATQPGEVIDDGRAAEGVAQITVGELCKLVNTMGGLTLAIASDQEFLDAVSKACVRPLEV